MNISPEDYCISLDYSLRSSGIILQQRNGTIKDFEIIKTTPSLKDEELLNHIGSKVFYFLEKHESILYLKTSFVIEGLSLASLSRSADLICGGHWHIRWLIHKYFSYLPIGVIPVLSWRSWAIPIEDRRNAKGIKDGLKKISVDYLPENVIQLFNQYIESTKGLNTKSIYDLADAYHLGRYRLYLDTLENKD